ncbi:MAG: prolipoprotein diacylglyceryl transferase [Parasporobacterium sp.]|nr:prolipoprotein diacylglyceryl transferase [Parasporobacterium sp.]
MTVFSIRIPMYGLMMAIGFLLCSVICFLRTRKRGLQGENLIIIAAMILLFALIGGFVFYALVTYSPEQIADFIREGDWESLLGGGIVFYGALIGGIIGAFIGSRIAKDDLRDYMDIIVPVIPLGHAIGRIGCFFAGCCYGRPTDSAIGVIYTDPAGGAPTGIRLLPTQLIESAYNLLLFGVLMAVSKRTSSRYLTTFLYCILYGSFRFVLEFFRYDSIRGIAGGLSTSQWVSLGLIAGALIAAAIYRLAVNRNKTSSEVR